MLLLKGWWNTIKIIIVNLQRRKLSCSSFTSGHLKWWSSFVNLGNSSSGKSKSINTDTHSVTYHSAINHKKGAKDVSSDEGDKAGYWSAAAQITVAIYSSHKWGCEGQSFCGDREIPLCLEAESSIFSFFFSVAAGSGCKCQSELLMKERMSEWCPLKYNRLEWLIVNRLSSSTLFKSSHRQQKCHLQWVQVDGLFFFIINNEP